VENIFIKYELEPEKIIMEVTENYIFEEAEHLKEIISKLNSIGICFSIDDFGTGNSSMTKLKHINFAEIKLTDHLFLDY
jgi:EAL domain-containing protein (putative c-di-GMP-specific phosphodiesterase class I)